MAIGVAAALASEAKAQISCPSDLSVEQRARAPSAEWTIASSGLLPLLAGVTVYDGPPERHVALKPDREPRGSDESVLRWELRRGKSTYWLSCEYTHTNVVIARPLPQDVIRCEAIVRRDVAVGDSRPPVTRVACVGNPTVRDREASNVHRGLVIIGGKEQTFVPCGTSERYWLVDATPGHELERAYAKIAGAPEMPIFVDVRGWIGAAPPDAARARVTRAITVTELRRAAPGGAGCSEDPKRFELIAFGNDPAWRLDVTPNGMSFGLPGAASLSFPYAEPRLAGGGLTYESSIAGPKSGVLVVEVRNERCIDASSGAHYTLAVEAFLDDRPYRGCAIAGDARRAASKR